MYISKILLIATCVILFNPSPSESTDVRNRRRNKDGSCMDSNGCYRFEQCEKNKCIDGCREISCGINASCQMINHIPICSCWENHTGDPFTECIRMDCSSSNDCYEFEKCENNQCISACESVSCGENAYCRTKFHHGICTCESGFIGDPLTGCARRSCTGGNECYNFEKCENQTCIDACRSSSCGLNAACNTENHSTVCKCVDKYSGDPYIGCVRDNCTSNNDCYDFEECKSNRCTSACESISCGENAWCNEKNHVGTCTCAWGFVGDPLVKCSERSCTTNEDCLQSEKCEDNKCIQICEGVLCGENAWCDINNHSAICTCIDSYGGDPNTECIRLGCITDNDCYETEKCEDNQCTPVCKLVLCGENAWCDVKDGVAVCSCMPGFTGGGLIECTIKDCINNDDCAGSEKCESKKCIDACDEVFCETNMWCSAKDHTPVCTCSDKYVGDIHTGCVRSNCTSNYDCYSIETCLNNECIPGCKLNTCGENAWCDVNNYVGVCTCMPGFTGNPHIECVHELHDIGEILKADA